MFTAHSVLFTLIRLLCYCVVKKEVYCAQYCVVKYVMLTVYIRLCVCVCVHVCVCASEIAGFRTMGF